MILPLPLGGSIPWKTAGETYWKRFYEAKKRKEKPLQYYRTM